MAAGSSGVSSFKVEQFDGRGNFTLWQKRVKDVLVSQGLARALKGKEEGKPAKMTDDDWEDLECRCVSTIRLYIADNIINNIDEDSAPELWKKLEKLYLAQKSMATKLNLKRDIYKLKMEAGANLMDHMNVFKGLLNQLERVGVKIEEEDRALLLLTSLPDTYDNIVDIFLYGKDTLKMEEVESTLLSSERRKKVEDKDSLFVAHGQRGRQTTKGSSDNSKARSKGSGKGWQCYKCKEWGHIKKDCPTWNKKDGHGSTAVADYNESGELLTVSIGNTSSHGDWILDSGSTHHICSRKEYFEKFQESKGGSFSLPDGSKVDVMGVGTVKIKMFNGVEHTLGGVAYVPKLQRNLISLSRLDSKGYLVLIAGGVMKITHGSMVLMKGEKCGGLYRLIGTQTSMVGWKRNAQEIKRLRKVSFAGTAETVVTCFQGSNDGEKGDPTGGGGESRPLFGANR